MTATQYFTHNQRAAALGAADYNSATFLTLSIRQVGSFQQIWEGSSGIAQGQSFDELLPQLGSVGVAGSLATLASGQTLIDVASTGSTAANMSGSLRFMDTETVSGDHLATTSQVKLRRYWFSRLLGRKPVRRKAAQPGADPDYASVNTNPNASAATSAFGNAYYIKFALPLGTASGDMRVLSNVNEINLATAQASTSVWNCDTQFPICDRAARGCFERHRCLQRST